MLQTIFIFGQQEEKSFDLLKTYTDFKFYYNPVEPGLRHKSLGFNDYIFSYNSLTKKIVKFDNEFNVMDISDIGQNIYFPSHYRNMYFDDNYFLVRSTMSRSALLLHDDKFIDSKKLDYDISNVIFIKNQTIIGEDENNNYFGLIIPDNFDEDLKYMNQDEIFAHIKGNWTGKDQFWIDQDRFILFGNRIITGDDDKFIEYFDVDLSFAWSLITVDKNNNYYWGDASRVLVFTKEGKLLRIIKTDAKYPMSPPTIDPSGNIYYFYYNEETYSTDLYRIKNDWSTNTPDPYEAVNKTGTVTEFRVRIRDNPSLYGKHIGYLTKNDRVEILSRTLEKMAIDDMNDYWYRIKRPDGTEGWTYGYFIQIEE